MQETGESKAHNRKPTLTLCPINGIGYVFSDAPTPEVVYKTKFFLPPMISSHLHSGRHAPQETMSTEKCFAKGSSAPGPVPKDRLRLYSMRFCPFAQRTRLVLNAKGIKYDTINIHLKEKPDWFLEKNPLGLVPALETPAGEVIYESPITCEYLDEAYPEKKLLPPSPFGKAQQRMMLENFSKTIPYFYKIPTARRNGEDVSGLETELKEKFAKLNEHLEKKNTKFFEGDTVTMIDYMMWPFFERIEVLELKHCLDHTPELKKWTERMLEDTAVKDTMFSGESYKAFYQSVAEGKPNYDYGL